MRKDEVIQKLAENLAELRADYQVADLAVFGSVVRDEAGPDSDVDILVDFARTPGLFKFLELKQRLEAILGADVDLVTRKALKHQLRDRILSEAEHVS